MEAIIQDVLAHFAQKLNMADLPVPRVDRDLEKFDLAFSIHNRLPQGSKAEAEVATKKIGDDAQALLLQNPHPLITKIEGAGTGFLNVILNRQETLKRAAGAVFSKAEKYGTSEKMKGKKVIIEHTSTNPNSTIHIGNLRNTITGAFVANIMRCVGYDVEEWFLVNDLGGQIGLTVVGFQKIYPVVKPTLKIDLWIGIIYAVCNTLQGIQDNGWKLKEAKEIILRGEAKEKLLHNLTGDALKEATTLIDVFSDLHGRYPQLVEGLVDALNDVEIRKDAAQWNLRYEHCDPEAVRLFRQMVTLTLSGQQETLDVYGVKHNKFCFESELGWEQSNDRVLEVLKKTPYFVPQTQCNEKGVPEGGYLDLDKYLKDAGIPQGKKMYQPNYPRFYLIRPDGSSLYSFRDTVFSIKKCDNADLVLNVICSEQNLAQEKVQLGLRLLAPHAAEKQWHLSYDLVRLVNCRMSGRRGIYVTADEVYQELKEATAKLMEEREQGEEEKGEGKKEEESSASSSSSPSSALYKPSIASVKEIAEKERITHEVATSAMKYTLLSASLHTELTFDIKKATNPNEASAPFLLYNYARFCSVLDKFNTLAKDSEKTGVFPLCELSEVNWDLVTGQPEWKLLMKYVLGFPQLVESIACPKFPERPGLPVFAVHLLPEFLISFVRDFSSFYKANRIIVPGEKEKTHARIWLIKMFQQVLGNGLRFMMIRPLERM
ncbi:putative arginyl-tRNA synthetase [Monocercomonoides exilis]|uniref:putative arginyl-tRNA synthetase n=1 Tax=Monocercomonoides exilis TaxID=2049356 RepID=UPI00355A46CE|nr:putative arginyl-tRNA synthetase [Monocercomonoides exilis]|eukprot:MONOS_3942.1-p1 / transcript=MONOS_3942.1 / gene=MONOS_3942 / organism=Monocercomonoides_exilis_PA203 / gene_product=arginyl-tRNA synthetase / transcript_product=arginyl-tRNA synthetase / location=Mono_scaffold00098:66875-69077(-) / protein_length=715 / sequence_SO=supercontig / SO=protein_coding / is_pseudo=false